MSIPSTAIAWGLTRAASLVAISARTLQTVRCICGKFCLGRVLTMQGKQGRHAAMAQWLNSFGDHGLWVMFLVTFAARVGVPVPAAPLLVVAGGLTVAGQASLPALLVVVIVANVLGDAIWFGAGRMYGPRVMKVLCRMSLSPDSCVRQSESLISRWGGSSLIAAKFIPGVSVVAAPMAGALGMAVDRFLFYGVVAGALWSAAYLGLGMVFSDQIERVLAAMAEAGAATGVAFASLLFAYVGWRYMRRRAFLRSIEMSRITVDDLYALIEAGRDPVIIDVRSDAALRVDGRRIPGALSINLGELTVRAVDLPRDREIILYCNCPNDASAASAALVLAKRGFTHVRPLQGGIDAWIAAGRETVLIAIE